MGLHGAVDRAFAAVVLRSARLYSEGFGDPARLDMLVASVRDATGAAAPIDVRWSLSRTVLGLEVRRGRFRSPVGSVLPPESHEGLIEAWSPPRAGSDRAEGRPAEGRVCLVLAATAEEGFARRRLLAHALARRGVTSWLLENPFYGARRPRGQRGASLRTVADQFAMNFATVEEARGLLATIRAAGLDAGTTGYSQGGMMAAFAAALSPFSVAVAPRGAGRSAHPIFTSGGLSRMMRWDVLAAEAGDLEAARETFAAALAPVRLDRFPAPYEPRRAVLLSARHDGFIPADEAEALHAHWVGSELRWLPAGHVTAVALHGRAQHAAILDAFAR